MDVEDVVLGQLSIEPAPGRNDNYFAISKRRGYFVKHAPTEAALELLAAEHAFYSVMSDAPVGWLAGFHSFDDREQLLILHRDPDLQDMFDADPVDPELGLPRVAASIGAALAELHSLEVSGAAEMAAKLPAPPWPLVLHLPHPGALVDLWPGQLKVLRALQQEPDVTGVLDEMAAGWTRGALIHGDVKFQNILVAKSAPERIVIVDWETVERGDPAWDVAAVLQSYLWFGVFLVSEDDEVSARDAPGAFARRLPAIQAQIRLFVNAYRQRSLLEPHRMDGLLDRATLQSGARLLQTAFELGQGEDSLGRLTSGALQLALNILRANASARAALMGIDL